MCYPPLVLVVRNTLGCLATPTFEKKWVYRAERLVARTLPQDCLTISLGKSTLCQGFGSTPLMLLISILAARDPISAFGCSMVVKGTSRYSASSMLSNPAIAMSSGTRRSIWRMALTAPQPSGHYKQRQPLACVAGPEFWQYLLSHRRYHLTYWVGSTPLESPNSVSVQSTLLSRLDSCPKSDYNGVEPIIRRKEAVKCTTQDTWNRLLNGWQNGNQ